MNKTSVKGGITTFATCFNGGGATLTRLNALHDMVAVIKYHDDLTEYTSARDIDAAVQAELLGITTIEDTKSLP